MIVHALYVIIVAPPEASLRRTTRPGRRWQQIPERVPRHSLAARLFHWIMAASMFTLLFTAFLPKVGVQFNWVLYHWIAGVVLTVSIVFHIVHASFFMDSGRSGLTRPTCAMRCAERCAFWASPRRRRRFAKYPLENKLYHLVIMLAGLAVTAPACS